MSFPRYDSHKESGVESLGEVPAHWAVVPFKQVIQRIESGTSVNAVDTPAAKGERGVLKTSCVYSGEFNSAENKAILPEEYDRASCPLRAGTLIVSRMNTPDLVGAAGLVRSEAEELYLPDRLWQLHLKNCEPAFVHFWTATAAYRSQVQMACSGTSSSMQNLAQDQLRTFWFPNPPRHEQTAIARFLDRETRKIDCLTKEQWQLIKLLKEKRQALISHAIINGLDPNAPMKASGVGWLGDVPKHWEVKPLMRLTAPGRDIMYGIVLPGPDVEEGVPIVKGGDVKPHRLRVDLLNRTTSEIELPFARARLKSNDVVYSIRGSIGDAELVPDELLDANITQDVARISPRGDVDPQWLVFAVRAHEVFAQLEQRSLGAAVKGINIFDLKRARIPVPPHGEQAAIGKFLKDQVEQLDQLSAAADQTIALLSERRTALISAAVTGKIALRGQVGVMETRPQVVAA